MLFDFKSKDKTTKIEIVWYCCKTRELDEWNRTESPEIDPHEFSQLILAKEQRQYDREKKQFFQKMEQNNWTSHESRHR